MESIVFDVSRCRCHGDGRKSENERNSVEKQILRQFSSALGGRTNSIVTGSAPTSQAVIQFLMNCFECGITNGYGSTEVGGISRDGVLDPNVHFKLEDIPDLEYFNSDKPFPRGEILVKTPHMISGYFGDQNKTKESFIDGYFRTGDVGELRNGKIYIIDRKKNVIKLAQGEFLVPERLENIFCQSELISQIYIHGNSLKSFVVAIVIPTKLFWTNHYDCLLYTSPSPRDA
eukprot:TRINITY_DN13119_c0_g1_i1.p1 TRINITY_DN13119_c0_g1~~TRINITY_DN13119_c0_g1_i1.p1  ORF type:complete len:231 (+),score=37.10 TRINITY_DN13119_c0_g1_i1:125-817(+)